MRKLLTARLESLIQIGMAKTLTVASVRRQLARSGRNPATDKQLDYLAKLIVERANAGKIRWQTDAVSFYTVYGAASAIDSLVKN